MTSTFKPIPSYESRYEISRDGQVYSLLNKRLLKPQVSKRGYLTIELLKDGSRKVLTIHRLLYKTFVKDTDKVIDHIDGNKLNNDICNLRECSSRQNLLNSKPQKNGTSKYKGVSFEGYTQRWRAQIRLNKKSYPIGRFDCEIEAARAYDTKASQLFGEFAWLNFPEKIAA